MKDGDVILLENTRYRAEETKNGDEFSKELASLCDVFVNENGILVVAPGEQPDYSQEELLTFLKKRKGILDGDRKSVV